MLAVKPLPILLPTHQNISIPKGKLFTSPIRCGHIKSLLLCSSLMNFYMFPCSADYILFLKLRI